METIYIEYRRSLNGGICMAGFWQNGDLIPEEEFLNEFRKSERNGHKFKILYGGVTDKEANEFKRRLENIAEQLHHK